MISFPGIKPMRPQFPWNNQNHMKNGTILIFMPSHWRGPSSVLFLCISQRDCPPPFLLFSPRTRGEEAFCLFQSGWVIFGLGDIIINVRTFLMFNFKLFQVSRVTSWFFILQFTGEEESAFSLILILVQKHFLWIYPCPKPSRSLCLAWACVVARQRLSC